MAEPDKYFLAHTRIGFTTIDLLNIKNKYEVMTL